jgi:predicted nuclease of predicted toxin-antitoxin system
MQFLADMGISMRVVEWLRLQSHDAVHLRDRGLQRLPNGDIFQLALQEKRIVLEESRHRIRKLPIGS